MRIIVALLILGLTGAYAGPDLGHALADLSAKEREEYAIELAMVAAALLTAACLGATAKGAPI